MKLPKLEDLNNNRFLCEAFQAEANTKLENAARLRRNIYLWFFLTGIACIFITVLTAQKTMGILSFFLTILSLVVMTEYDTQLYFLRILKSQMAGKREESGPTPE